ncbi:M1 family metallopeptidase [Thermoflavifilum thermophilum]|uniref:Peptidase family M1 n=1 Tax=Thermoflavifilum thermophilum TaxID=1393122 RepID=A0A1I7MZA6_9BACT|nr:M1 family metallopeptidase [Thermoflavifilum thermophilum]SFV27753.1 Peptidase family M1 [Thermoflavifilum thermophilum]
MKNIFSACLVGLLVIGVGMAHAQQKTFTHQDTLRGSNTPQRAWWDVVYYDLHVAFLIDQKEIKGYNAITYRVIGNSQDMQIDLMEPLVIDSVMQNQHALSFYKDGNAYFVRLNPSQKLNSLQTITVYYHGAPHQATNPPWQGGVTWTRDSLGNPWVVTSCQGFGASSWWPCKDYLGDEPDSQQIAITVPDTLMDVSNGRLRRVIAHPNHTKTFVWFVDDPINNYDVAVNIGKYAHWQDVYQGLKGRLTLNYWVMPYHLKQSHIQFQQVKSMLKCFEYWFGPYPWYRDGYQLVETPYLGMEHQSCVAYGNHYENGYLGRDLSGTGWGLKWDFIIVHESAHEWFGNNITDEDIADMWIHESFANYAEALYVECRYGKKAGEEYVIGCRKNIRNDRPIIGYYGVNDEGSEDMYYKGGNMLNMIRQIIHHDSLWRQILRGLNHTFWHQTVTSRQIEQYIIQQSHIDLQPVFDQYLRTTKIPVLEYAYKGGRLYYRWQNTIPDFHMPVDVRIDNHAYRLQVHTQWQEMSIPAGNQHSFEVNQNYYITVREVTAPE